MSVCLCNSFDEYVIFNVQTIAHNAIFAVDHYCNNEWSWRWWWREADLTSFFAVAFDIVVVIVFGFLWILFENDDVVCGGGNSDRFSSGSWHFIHTTIINTKLKYSCSISNSSSFQMEYICIDTLPPHFYLVIYFCSWLRVVFACSLSLAFANIMWCFKIYH